MKCKPTKASKHQLHPTSQGAMSYFVGDRVVDGGYDEDGGFTSDKRVTGWAADYVELWGNLESCINIPLTSSTEYVGSNLNPADYPPCKNPLLSFPVP